jgi:hypothetical protein
MTEARLKANRENAKKDSLGFLSVISPTISHLRRVRINTPHPSWNSIRLISNEWWGVVSDRFLFDRDVRFLGILRYE